MSLETRPLETENKQGPVEAEPDELSLPPRKALHSTERERWLRIFYRTLLWLFILLVVGLLVWGWRRVRGEI
ncbi:hypothetical protein [Paenibacillus rigui]|uniref:Uncharacterized protein n=1 Tax=Paenibacillus rigui TaxID=554312 RepID=A0A229UYC7_9BACL|nr:hypothetical protein [Paenibacillus rigui]OXM88095.1 hypothetical protein CF651_03125 [Paenibacillus rigui]